MYRELGPLDELTKIDQLNGRYDEVGNPLIKTINIDMDTYYGMQDIFLPQFLKTEYNSVIDMLETHLNTYLDPADTPKYAKDDFTYIDKVREALEVLGEYYGVKYES